MHAFTYLHVHIRISIPNMQGISYGKVLRKDQEHSKSLQRLRRNDKLYATMPPISLYRPSPLFRRASFILFLSLCIIVQMLGVPATLLNPVGSDDLSTASMLEGLSLPPTVHDLYVHSGSSVSRDLPSTVQIPVLLHSFFHPPLV